MSRPEAIASARCAQAVGGAPGALVQSPAARKPTSAPMKQ